MNLLRTYLGFLIITFLTACGGGVENSSNFKTGILMDSAVDGLRYKTASNEGITQDNGKFTFKVDEEITFYLGQNLIGTSSASDIITPIDLTKEATHSDTLINILRLLQSLDEDDNPENGISLSAETQKIADDTIFNFSVSQDDFSADSNVLELLARTGKSNGLIDAGQAILHFQTTLIKENIKFENATNLFKVGGLISGLNGTLVLTNYSLDAIQIDNSKKFQFNIALPDSTNYKIAITRQPQNQTCRLINGEGKIKSADVSSISIICETFKQSITGVVTGLSGSLILVSGDSRYFITSNGRYSVSSDKLLAALEIEKQPNNQSCKVRNQSDLDSQQYDIVCTNDTFSLGGSITGLAVNSLSANGQLSGLTLQNFDGSLLYLSDNNSFVFSNQYPIDQHYIIDVVKQPVGQHCDITNAAGIYSPNSNNLITISCEKIGFNLNVNVTGLNGLAMPVLVNGREATEISAGLYEQTVVYDEPYHTSFDSPATKNCEVISGIIDGNMPAANITINVSCVDVVFQYKILTNNFIDSLELVDQSSARYLIESDLVYLPAEYNSTYNFSLVQQPTGQTCIISGGNGLVDSVETEITINCGNEKHTAHVSIIGLKTPINIQNSNTGQQFIGTNSQYVFDVEFGQQYDIRIIQQPEGQTCSLINATGTVSTNDINDITILCIGTPYVVDVAINNLHGNVSLLNNGAQPIFTSLDKVRFEVNLNDSYSITIGGEQPAGQNCSFKTQTTGTVTSTSIPAVELDCLDLDYIVAVNVSNLHDISFSLYNNSLSANEILNLGNNKYQYNFNTTHTAFYDLTILKSALGQTCSFDSVPRGQIKSANVRIDISCKNDSTVLNVEVKNLRGDLILENTLLPNSSKHIITSSIVSIDAINYEPYTLNSISPLGQKCTFDLSKNSFISGVAELGQIPNIILSCKDDIYSIVVTVNNLQDMSMKIDNSDVVVSPVATNDPYKYTYTFAAVYLEQYDLFISNQAAGQDCTFDSAATGQVKASNVSVLMSCKNQKTSINVEVNNLNGEIELQNLNMIGSNKMTSISGVTIIDAAFYESYILKTTSPAGQACTFDASGTDTISGILPVSVVPNIKLSCKDAEYSINVTVSNLRDTNLKILNNGIAVSPVASNVQFTYIYTFNTTNAAVYALSVGPENLKQTCQFKANDILSGTVNASNVNFLFSCVSDIPVSLPINIENLKGTLSFSDIVAKVDFNLSTATGLYSTKYFNDYNIAILTNPTAQTCTINSGENGFIGNGMIVPVKLSCVDTQYVAEIVLSNINDDITLFNGASSWSISKTATSLMITFNQNEAYNFTIVNNTAPRTQQCSLIHSNVAKDIVTGTVNASNISGISIDCQNLYTVSGSISGPVGNLTINNGHVDLQLANNATSYGFPPFLLPNEMFSLSIDNSMSSQFCEFTNKQANYSHSVGVTGNIANIDVNCFSLYKLPIQISGIEDLTTLPQSVLFALEISDHNGVVDQNLSEELSVSSSGIQYSTYAIPAEYSYKVTLTNNLNNCAILNESNSIPLDGNINPVMISCSGSTTVINQLNLDRIVPDVNLQKCLIATAEGSEFSALTTLDCSNTDGQLEGKIKSIEGLKNFQNLEILSLTNQAIIDFDEIRYLTKLSATSVISNNTYPLIKDLSLKEIPDPKLLKCVQELYPSISARIDDVLALTCIGNPATANTLADQITNLTGISLFTNLQSINLYNNAITEIAEINKLHISDLFFPTVLKQLVLADNSISSLAGIYALKELRILDLRNNQLSNLDALTQQDSFSNYYLSQLNLVNLRGNSVTLPGTEINFIANIDKFLIDSNITTVSMNDNDIITTTTISPRLFVQRSNDYNINNGLNVPETRNRDITTDSFFYDNFTVSFTFQPAANKYDIYITSPHGVQIELENGYVNTSNLNAVTRTYDQYTILGKDAFYSLLGMSTSSAGNGRWEISIKMTEDNGVDGRVNDWTITY